MVRVCAYSTHKCGHKKSSLADRHHTPCTITTELFSFYTQTQTKAFSARSTIALKPLHNAIMRTLLIKLQ